MSMISSQCDELRELAKAFPETSTRRTLLMRAADTILELRGDLQRANDAVQDAEHDESVVWDRVCKVERENAKLRELVRNWYPHMLKRVGRDALRQWGQMDVVKELRIELGE